MAEMIDFPLPEGMELTGRTIVTVNLGKCCDDDGNQVVGVFAEMEKERYFALCQMARMFHAPSVQAALCAHVLEEAGLLEDVVAIASPRQRKSK